MLLAQSTTKKKTNKQKNKQKQGLLGRLPPHLEVPQSFQWIEDFVVYVQSDYKLNTLLIYVNVIAKGKKSTSLAHLCDILLELSFVFSCLVYHSTET